MCRVCVCLCVLGVVRRASGYLRYVQCVFSPDASIGIFEGVRSGLQFICIERTCATCVCVCTCDLLDDISDDGLTGGVVEGNDALVYERRRRLRRFVLELLIFRY